MMNYIESVFAQRRVIVGESNWPTPELITTWSNVELVRRHDRYNVHAQDELCHNHTREWAAWNEAATIIGAEIVARLEGITWMDALNLLNT